VIEVSCSGQYPVAVVGPRQSHETVLVPRFTDDLLDFGQGLFGKKHLVERPASDSAPWMEAISSEASRSCLRADHMLMESEHNIAREDKEGSVLREKFKRSHLLEMREYEVMGCVGYRAEKD
jgi:hypothetical protein